MMPFFSVALAAEFVLLAPQGTLHLTPDGPASAPWAMEPLPMELLAEDGEWLQVRSTRGHCYEDIGAGNAVSAEVWIRREHTAQVTTERQRFENEDGSWVEVGPGLAVTEGQARLPWDRGVQEVEHIGDRYTPDGRVCHQTSGGHGADKVGGAGAGQTVEVVAGQPLTDPAGRVSARVVQSGRLPAQGECLLPFGGELMYCEPLYVVVRDDAVLYRSEQDGVGVRMGRGGRFVALQVTGEGEGRTRVAFPDFPAEHCHGVDAPEGLEFWVDDAALQTVTTTEAFGVLPGAVLTEDGLDTGRMQIDVEPGASGTRYTPAPRVPPQTDLSLIADDEDWLGDLVDSKGEVYLLRGDQVAAIQTGRRTVRLQDTCAKVEVKTWRSQIRPFYIPEFADPTVPLTGMSARLEPGTPLFWVEGPSAGWTRTELKVEEVEGTCGTLRVGEDTVRVCW